MTFAALEGAHGGRLYEHLARLSGFSADDCRALMAGLGPAIAARVRETARDGPGFEQLLDLLEDNESDLLAGGDLDSRDTQEDGLAVLVSAYGSEDAAHEEARKTAKALRLDESAVLRLLPVAAALVLAMVAKRHREVAGPGPEDGDRTPQSAEGTPSRGGVLSVLVAAFGAGIARAIVNRFLPRRRRRYGYGRTRRRAYSRTRRRQPSLEDLFRGLLR